MAVDATLTFKFRDEYNRKPIAKKIIRLLESDVDVSPLVIDGGWGTGKSEFCHKLINLLENDDDSKLRSVYVDAFKADHADEPLMTLLAAVLKLLPEAEQKTLTEKALPAIRFGTKTALKAGVSWLLKQEATAIADDFEDVLQDASDDAINHSIESILADHVKADESIEALKSALIELAKEKPIVIFVDELDRCRPDFAISMLESIKHIFDVEGVQFVLVVNSEQLKASVNHCYGRSVIAQKYLDKFIGFKFALSKLSGSQTSEYRLIAQQHLHRLVMKSSELQKSVIGDNQEVMIFLKEIIKINNYSLREVETFIRYLAIYQSITNGNDLRAGIYPGRAFLRVFGVCLFCFNQELILEENNHSNIHLILKVLNKHDSDLYELHTFEEEDIKNHEIVAASLILNEKEGSLRPNENEWEKIVKRKFGLSLRCDFNPQSELDRVVKALT